MILTIMIFTILIWVWLVGTGATLSKIVKNQELMLANELRKP